MQRRNHAQREHIIHSLDSLLYQLHALSFFLSPSVWTLLCRLISQHQLAKPRELDASLRFWFGLIVFLNAGTVWSHATQGAAEGRAILLDFVGMAYTPSKAHLLFLDFVIILLQWLLATIAYETSIATDRPANDSVPDVLYPISSTITPESHASDSLDSLKPLEDPDSMYIIDLRLSPILRRLRSPPPVPRPTPSDLILPMPNTTARLLPTGLRMVLQARAEMRERALQATPATSTVESERRVPGAMDPGDGG